VFVNDIKDVANRSESVVRDRRRATVAQHTEREGGEETGHSCLAHREREKGRNRPQLPGTQREREGKKRATVAWLSPGLGLGVYIWVQAETMYATRNE